VALGLPALAVAATAAWIWLQGAPWLDTSPAVAVILCVAAVCGERVYVQLGPRSWYTASTPAVVLAGLLGGPLLGAAVGASTQLIRPEAVWRRRAAEGGIATLQGLVAGFAGSVLLDAASSPVRAAAAAMAAAVAVNSVGRFLVILERHPRLLWSLWPKGFRIDLIEAVLAVPLLATLVVTYDSSAALTVTTVSAVLAAMLIVQRNRATTAAALAAEQANARRDQLTGAANRRAFEEAMAAEHARVMRGSVPAGLYLVDLDRFKSVNDASAMGSATRS
jgi:hypothetical protein